MLKQVFLAFVFAAVFSPRSAGYGQVLVNMGYVPSAEPVEVVELVIPEQWGAVYMNYNELQRQGGFDLEPYKGRACVRYTYEIPDMFARGNILVCDGKIIGGDICSITLDGIMIPIERDRLK